MTQYTRVSLQTGLTDSDILDIRAFAASTGANTVEVGYRWNIDRTTAARIINRRTWSHVPNPKTIGAYTIYPDGRVFSKASGRFMTTSKGRDGLQYVELRTNGNREKVAVATLVARAFLGTKSRKLTFVNGDRSNAHFTNIAIAQK